MIVDHLDKLELSDDMASTYYNELHSLLADTYMIPSRILV